jgi:hypothetical protein
MLKTDEELPKCRRRANHFDWHKIKNVNDAIANLEIGVFQNAAEHMAAYLFTTNKFSMELTDLHKESLEVIKGRIIDNDFGYTDFDRTITILNHFGFSK